MKLAKLALGTWLMGGTKDPDPNNDDQKDIQVIQTAIESGITLIDTAQNYAAGKCEELVGEAIKKYDRDEFQILTKQIKSELSYGQVIDGCRASLKRLGLDYLDYFVCHAPNQEFDMRDFFKAANQLYKDGLIKNVGVSNFGSKSLEIALKASDLPISLNQVSFSLSDHDIISSGTYEFCLENNIPVQAYRTLVGVKEDQELMNMLAELAKKYGISSYQLAIAYLNSFENMHFTVRASTKDHWQQLKAALDIKLTDEAIRKLKSYHETQRGQFGHFLNI